MSSQALVPSGATSTAIVAQTNNATQNMFVTMTVADQIFGIPVLMVQDVLGPQQITHVPLAPKEVLGSLNLRGRIVTSIDVRTRLELSANTSKNPSMNIVVEQEGELYSLAVDRVGEVMSLSNEELEKNPPTMDPRWQEVSDGIYRLKECLLVVLNVSRLLRLDKGSLN